MKERPNCARLAWVRLWEDACPTREGQGSSFFQSSCRRSATHGPTSVRAMTKTNAVLGHLPRANPGPRLVPTTSIALFHKSLPGTKTLRTDLVLKLQCRNRPESTKALARAASSMPRRTCSRRYQGAQRSAPADLKRGAQLTASPYPLAMSPTLGAGRLLLLDPQGPVFAPSCRRLGEPTSGRSGIPAAEGERAVCVGALSGCASITIALLAVAPPSQTGSPQELPESSDSGQPLPSSPSSVWQCSIHRLTDGSCGNTT